MVGSRKSTRVTHPSPRLMEALETGQQTPGPDAHRPSEAEPRASKPRKQASGSVRPARTAGSRGTKRAGPTRRGITKVPGQQQNQQPLAPRQQQQQKSGPDRAQQLQHENSMLKHANSALAHKLDLLQQQLNVADTELRKAKDLLKDVASDAAPATANGAVAPAQQQQQTKATPAKKGRANRQRG